MIRFLIWGGGGHGKVVADLIRACGHRVVGFADADRTKLGHVVEPGGSRVVVSETELIRSLEDRRFPAEVAADAVALAIGENRMRLRCLDSVGDLPAPALIHPSAVVSPSARVGRATVVFPLAVVQSDARIGAGAIVNTGAIVEHDCTVEEGAHLSPRATLCGAVRVGAGAWVGAGATIIPGVSIGEDAIVGAGAVVIRNVSEGQRIAGVPAKPLSTGILL